MFQMSSKKRVAAAALGLGLGLAGSALAGPPLQHKSATMQCAERRVALDAECFPYAGRITMCTRQSIRFFSAEGKVLGARVFHARPLEGADYPAVEEQFGELDCVETKAKQKFVVALMDNGGNCDQCEWSDVYSLDGILLGSTRNRKKIDAELDAAITAAYAKDTKHVLSHQPLTSFYQEVIPPFLERAKSRG